MSDERFALDFDPVHAVAHLRRVDASLAVAIDQVGPLQMHRRYPADPFLALLRAIVYQQLSGKAAASIYARVMALLPDGDNVPAALLALPDAQLRGAGLSRAKTAAARDLAARTLEGVVPGHAELAGLDDEAIVARLTRIRGVGRWTVEMLLIFGLGRADVLPAGDLGVRKGFQLTHAEPELPAPQALLVFGERWRPYRSAASWYLWRVLDVKG